MQMLKATSANIVFTEPDPNQGVRTRMIWDGDETALTLEHDGPVNDFIEAILQQRAPQTSLRDALLFARLADGIYQSADTGKAVTFD
jgi:predicted dehydrogenase